jgi:hypothetical protein
LVRVIARYGEENVLGILFDNSAAKIFTKDEFKMTTSYIDSIESLQFVETDLHGTPYHIIKDVEDIQGILIKDENFEFESYDKVRLRG